MADYYFSRKKADRAVKFFERVLSHSKGEWAGKPFVLEPFQKKIVRQIFGWLRRDTGLRRYRTVYIEIPKKNGKSPLAAGIILYLLVADDEPGAEIYGAAADKDQASIVFNYARDCVLNNRWLNGQLKVIESRKRILYPETNSMYVAVSSDVPTKHGPNISGLVVDELHAQPNRDLVETLHTGTAARRQPLSVFITTAGTYDESSICWEWHEHTRQVNEGTVKDDTHFGVIYAAGKQDDWTDEKVWFKANPALGVFRSLEQMRTEAERAKRVLSYQNTFRRLYLNQWTQQVDRWIDMAKWHRSAGEVYEQDLIGEECYAGLDLSSRVDLTALVYCFPDDDGYFDILCRFFMPDADIEERSRKDGVPYAEWADMGYLELTPGEVVDYDYVVHRLKTDYEQFFIRELAYDRWGANYVVQKIEDEVGVPVVEFGQGYASMSVPSKGLYEAIVDARLRHGNNPVLDWMADCVTVKHDPTGDNIKPVKPDRRKTTKRVDGIVASIMAFDRATRDQGSLIYEERGVATI